MLSTHLYFYVYRHMYVHKHATPQIHTSNVFTSLDNANCVYLHNKKQFCFYLLIGFALGICVHIYVPVHVFSNFFNKHVLLVSYINKNNKRSFYLGT